MFLYINPPIVSAHHLKVSSSESSSIFGDNLVHYYGAADTVTGLCFGYIDEINDYIKKN